MLFRSVSCKYLTQIDAFSGNAAASDAAVAGIDRELSKQITALRDDFVKFTEAKGAEKMALADADFKHRRTIVIVWIVLLLVLSFFLASLIIRGVFRQLGGDPLDVARVVNVMAAGDFSQQPNKFPDAGSLLADAYRM